MQFASVAALIFLSSGSAQASRFGKANGQYAKATQDYVPKKVIDGIDLMRAEVCAAMYDKHHVNYAAFEKCKEFMNLFCRPGKDRMMDGDRKEISTGKGYCQLFFPVSKKIAKVVGDSKRAAEKVLGKSSYGRHPGKTLGEPIPGESKEYKVPAAQAACQALGNKCAGFTCDIRERVCTLRGPGTCDAAPVCLTDSSEGEVSFVKPEEDYDDEQEGAGADDQGAGESHGHGDGRGGGDEDGGGGAGPGNYERHAGKTLGEVLEGEGEPRSVEAAHARCEELGDKCAGFTCDNDEKKCTLRSHGDLVDCSKGSVSFVKPGGGNGHGVDHDGGSSSYSRQKGKTLGERIPGHDEIRGVAEAQAACDKLGEVCAGFTCDKNDEVCTLRSEGDLVDCPEGSISYVKDSGGSSSSDSSGSGGLVIHMDEDKGSASQGFKGAKVEHDDQETSTGDWLKEFGPNSKGTKTVEEICKEKPNEWCRSKGYPTNDNANKSGVYRHNVLVAFLASAVALASQG